MMGYIDTGHPTRTAPKIGGPGMQLGLGFGNKGTDRPLIGRFSPYSNRGFALVTVIWGLGLITLIGTAAIVGSRYRANTSAEVVFLAEATMAADSAVNLVIVETLHEAWKLRPPTLCRMPGGEIVYITITPEVGKVDLNTATPTVLSSLFRSLTGDASVGARYTSQIMAFRNPPRNLEDQSNVSLSATSALGSFRSILQLDQVIDMSPQLFRAVLPFLTTYSGRAEPDANAASLALRRILNIDQKETTSAQAVALTGAVTIRADALGRNGARFVRETLVSLGNANGQPITIREWRRGEIDGEAFPLSENNGLSRVQDCLTL